MLSLIFMRRIRAFFYASLYVLLCTPLALHASVNTPLPSHETLNRSWTPISRLYGVSDRQDLASPLQKWLAVQSVMLKPNVEQGTQRFIDRFWASLERFDLDGMYDLLPLERALSIAGRAPQRQRYIQFHGRAQGQHYQWAPAKPTARRNEWGDMDIQVSMLQDAEQDARYLFNAKASVNAGTVTWPSFVDALQQTLDVLTNRDPALVSDVSLKKYYTEKALRANQHLQAEDLERLIPLWASFPNSWAMFSAIARIDDLVVSNANSQGYHDLNLRLVMDLARTEQHYPALARYLKNIDRTLQLDLDIYDGEGRLLKLHVDSAELLINLQATVKDGQLLPRSRTGVLQSNQRNGMQRFEVIADARVDLLGVIANVENLNGELFIRESTLSANPHSALLRFNTVPRVSIEGRALGVMPTGFINSVIPKSLEAWIQEFSQVAFNGNGGQGIVGRLDMFDAQGDQSTRMAFSSQFEGLDNFFVKIGMGMINERIVPDEKESEQVRQLLRDAQLAFSKDLERYTSSL